MIYTWCKPGHLWESAVIEQHVRTLETLTPLPEAPTAFYKINSPLEYIKFDIYFCSSSFFKNYQIVRKKIKPYIKTSLRVDQTNISQNI